MTATKIITTEKTTAFNNNDFGKKLQIVTAGLERYFATMLKTNQTKTH
jgi:hypothetical protein